MDKTTAIDAFAALAQETRLEALRLLVRVGPDGLPAGEIGRTLGVPHNTLSTHLAALTRAGLVRSRKEGRSVVYAADFAGLRALIGFLLQDCCGGHPEICAPVVASLGEAACGQPAEDGAGKLP